MKKVFITVICLFCSGFLFGFMNNMNSPVPEEYQVDSTNVKVTIYKPYTKHSITASGFKINYNHAGMHRLIAVSRDLLKKYPFGTKVLVKGTESQLDGIYTVSDLMAARWRNKIDILVDRKYPLVSYKSAKLIKINSEFFYGCNSIDSSYAKL